MEKANYPVARMANSLGVARSGHYSWKHHLPTEPRVREGERERQTVTRSLRQDLWLPQGACRFGSHGRLCERQNGCEVDAQTELERGRLRKFRPVATIRGVPTHKIPDRDCRKWDRDVLNQVWISDITYLFTGERWLFLCVVCRACSRQVIE